jgi:putative transposase
MRPHPGAAVASFKIPDGWTVQAFAFALDCTPGQVARVNRQFGGRRYARNWAVRTLKDDIARYRETGQETQKPSLARLRKRWNREKDAECTDAGTGQAWWPQISKEAFADGIKGAVDAYWNWQQSRAGTRAGKKVGFPRFAKKGVEPDHRRPVLPVVEDLPCVRARAGHRVSRALDLHRVRDPASAGRQRRY